MYANKINDGRQFLSKGEYFQAWNSFHALAKLTG